MKFKLNKTQLIGLFVILTLATLYFVINFLKGEDVFKKRVTYYSVFNNVEGLTPTSPVYISGLKVGSVEKIKFDNNNLNFTVKLSIKDYYNIPDNSIVEIYSSDILGSKSIRINIGNSKTLAEVNDTLASTTIPDMLTVFQREMGPLKDQVSNLILNMNEALLKINNILDSNVQNNLKQTISELNTTMRNAKNITGNLSNLSPEIKSLICNLNILADNLKTGSEDLNATLKNANKISEGISESDLKGTIENLKETLIKIQDPNGSIGKLMSTDSLHTSISELVNNINNLVEKISENPKKYIKISVF